MDSVDIRNHASGLIAAWRAAGLEPELIEPVGAAFQRYNELGPEIGALEADASGAYKEIAAEVVAGLSLAEGVDALARRTASNERISQASSALRGRTLFETSRGLCLKAIREHLEQDAGALFAACDDAEAKPGRGAKAESRRGAVQAVRNVLARLGLEA